MNLRNGFQVLPTRFLTRTLSLEAKLIAPDNPFHQYVEIWTKTVEAQFLLVSLPHTTVGVLR